MSPGCVRVIGLAACLATVACSPVVAQDDTWIGGSQRSSRPPASSSAPGPPRRIGPSTAQSYRSDKVEIVGRDILALYDGAREPSPDRTRIHRYLELPLNHLGLRVVYWDLAKGLPDGQLADRARAVVTWFTEPLADARPYLEWAARMAAEETRFVVLDEPGAAADGAGIAATNSLLRHIGVDIGARWVGPAEAGSIVERTADLVEFEHKLADPLPGYRVIEPAGPISKAAAFKAHLTLESRRVANAAPVRSSVIVTGPGGGYASTGFVRHLDPASGQLRWVIDPFRFLAAALDLERFPVPDTTTVSGRRLYFSHVDGSGWLSPAGPEESAAAAITRRLIERYPDLPVSIGLIGNDASPARPDAKDVARQALLLFSRPHVEAASLGLTYPYQWEFFGSYDRSRELARIHTNRARAVPIEQQSLGALAKLGRHHYSALTDRAYAAGGPHLPRAGMLKAFNLADEIAGGLDRVASLAPEGKRPRLYLWSGDALPFEAAVKASRAAGARNINGGGGRLDAQFPSLMYLSPVARPVGGERQIYAVNADDATYTNGWRGPDDGQHALAETWANTGAPRRIKGLNLRFSMLSGTRPDALATLDKLLAQVRAAQVAPITASQYAAIADGFHDTEITRLRPQRWRIAKRGALHTVRFDDTPGLFIDFKNSAGVLGQVHEGRTLYVTLDPAAPEAIVALTSTRPNRQEDERAYLVESRWRISRLRTWRCGLDAEAQGFGPGQMTWRGVPPGEHIVTATRTGDPVEVLRNVNVGSDGELKIALEADATAGLKLRIACARPSQARNRSTWQ